MSRSDPYAQLRKVEFLQHCIKNLHEVHHVVRKSCTDLWHDFQEVVFTPQKDSIKKNGTSVIEVRMLVFFVKVGKGIEKNIEKYMDLLLRTRVELTYTD